MKSVEKIGKIIIQKNKIMGEVNTGDGELHSERGNRCRYEERCYQLR